MHRTSGNTILTGVCCALLLGALTALDPQLLGLGPQDARDRHTEHVGLDHGQRERVELLDVGAVREVAEGVGARHAQLDLLQHAGELRGQHAGDVLDDLRDGGVERQARLDADRQQVQRVRQRPDDLLLALLDPAVQDRVGQR